MKKIVIIVISIIVTFSCSSFREEKKKKALLIIPPKSVQDKELITTKEILENSGIIVDVTSIKGGEVRGMSGGIFQTDLKISDVKVKKYDIVICIGGTGVAHIMSDKSIISVIKQFKEADKYISAICLAPGILANAGVINGHNITSYPDRLVMKYIENNGATYIKEPVVVSGKIITGNGPNASEEFAETIVKILNSEKI